MYVYECGPIDFWNGFMSEAEFRQHVSKTWWQPGFDDVYVQEFWAALLSGARKLGWEGDMREGPYYAPLPPHEMGAGPGLIIAFKQDNNGQTFVGSSYRLPYLEDGKNWLESAAREQSEPA
jgi:hypothetical protein